MYIDAGTGSMLLQAAAGFFTFLVFFRQITAWFKAQFTAKEKNTHEHISH